jgi:hypothetical protein
MLPSIDPQQRRILPYHRVLIRICSNLDLTRLVIFYEPGPARALDAGEGGVEFGFEGGEVAVGGFDCGLHPYTLASSFQLFIYLSSYNVNGQRGEEIPSQHHSAPPHHHSYSVPDSPKTAYDSHVRPHGN